jgi:hypothetical protein
MVSRTHAGAHRHGRSTAHEALTRAHAYVRCATVFFLEQSGHRHAQGPVEESPAHAPVSALLPNMTAAAAGTLESGPRVDRASASAAQLRRCRRRLPRKMKPQRSLVICQRAGRGISGVTPGTLELVLDPQLPAPDDGTTEGARAAGSEQSHALRSRFRRCRMKQALELLIDTCMAESEEDAQEDDASN